MDRKTAYTRKAELYARYRWDYSSAAFDLLFEKTRLAADACVVDLGAGTGILTRHFAGRARQVLGVELNLTMCQQAAQYLGDAPGCRVLAAGAEAVPLPSGCADLVCAAQAVHWFDAEPARSEIRRILKPGGWLAVLRNYSTDDAVGRAMGPLHAREYGVEMPALPRRVPNAFYFEGGEFRRYTFPFSFQQGWQDFLGAMLSASYMPDEDHPLFPKLERAARQVFAQFSHGGQLEVCGETELYLGQFA